MADAPLGLLIVDVEQYIQLARAIPEDLRDLRGDPEPLKLIERMLSMLNTVQRERIAIQQRERILTCVFCGHEYPPDTPTSNHASLRAHVAVCEQHPAAKYRRERDALQRAWDAVMGAIPLRPEIRTVLESPDTSAIQGYSLAISVVRDVMCDARGTAS